MTGIAANAVMVGPRAGSGKCCSDAVLSFLFDVSSHNLGEGNTSPIFWPLQSISSLLTQTHCAPS